MNQKPYIQHNIKPLPVAGKEVSYFDNQATDTAPEEISIKTNVQPKQPNPMKNKTVWIIIAVIAVLSVVTFFVGKKIGVRTV